MVCPVRKYAARIAGKQSAEVIPEEIESVAAPTQDSKDTHRDLLTLLTSQQDCEFTCTDAESDASFVVTIRTDKLFGAPFLAIPFRQLQSTSKNAGRIYVGSNVYAVAHSFRKSFLEAVKMSRRDSHWSVDVRTVTVQSPRGIMSFLGKDRIELSQLVVGFLPSTVTINGDSLQDLRRDQGRKVGHAAKDLALLKSALLTPDRLMELELGGAEVASEAVEKDKVIGRETLPQLRDRGMRPAIACLMVHCRRIIKKRPEKNPESRAVFVRTLTQIFDQLPNCANLDDAREALAQIIAELGGDSTKVLGARFCNFAVQFRYGWRNDMIASLKRVDSEKNENSAWRLADLALAVTPSQRSEDGLPLPTRVSRKLSLLQRIGPEADFASGDGLISKFGFTGVELGKWVRNSESVLLQRLVSEACFDLQRLLGTWMSLVSRKGNLALALGARGKGGGCAHYQPALRVINLTKTNGDGSFAHEFAHFLDHMVASYSAEGSARFLSDRVSDGNAGKAGVANAMVAVMGVIGTAPTNHQIFGDSDPNRWYRQVWVLKAWERMNQNPQATFDILVERNAKQFRTGNSAAQNCQTLANSLAKWTGVPITVNACHKKESPYLKQARRLGIYWARPHELFARAFEAWCEDKLQAQAQTNEYLVDGTRRDYSKCRGLPYPVGEQRDEIHLCMNRFVSACADQLEQ